jgi:hypothetical protein
MARASTSARRQGKRVSSRSRSAGRSKQTRSRRLSKTTTDHEEIRSWAEERGGKPACVKGTGGKGDAGMIRLEFPGYSRSRDESLQKITWDEFFEKFDHNGLALVYQEKTASGQKSNFNKLISASPPKVLADKLG